MNAVSRSNYKSARPVRRNSLHLEQLDSRNLPVVYPIGEQFLVNEAFSIETDSPSIAMLDYTGAFVAAWESYEEGEDYLGFGIYAQRFNADGSPAGAKMLVSGGGDASSIAGDQLAPAVASDGLGNFIVVWQSKEQETGDFDIYGRWFVGGQALDRFRLNQQTQGDQINPDVCMDSLGNAVVVWQSEGEDSDGFGIISNRLSRGQTQSTSETIVNTIVPGNQTNPDVAVASAGRYVITWQGEDLSATEPTIEVYGRRYNNDTTPIDVIEFQANTVEQRDQVTPKVAIDDGANFVIVWVSEGIPGSGSDVFGQQ